MSLERLSYTIKDAAEVSGYSEDTIRKAIKSGDLKANRPVIDGREVAKENIARAELERWLAAPKVA